jgi:tetratricopeptide (TPR) repeat protein
MIMKRSSSAPRFVLRSLSLPAVLLLAVAFAPPATADAVDAEFRFASGLIDRGFPDFAEKVIAQVLRLHPELKDRAQIVQAEILVSRRKFGDAEALLKTLDPADPKAQAIHLALAKGYYAMGDVQKAKDLYNVFFKSYEGKVPTDPDLLRFYQDAAYQFGQMLEMAGDLEGAIKAYGRVLAGQPDKSVSRGIWADQAGLYVRLAEKEPGAQREQRLNEAKKICENIQWGGLDIWFGQSVVVLARIELVRGNRAAAQKVLQGNLDILKEIDGFMKEQGMPLTQSPMAGARFMLGELLQEQADALARDEAKKDEAVQTYGQALTEFYNVFAKYGTSDWGPESGVRAQRLKSLLETQYGKKVNIDLGQYQAQAAETQFRLADSLYRQNQFAAAAAEYLKNLNMFPESDASLNALANLTMSYAQLGDTLMVKTLIAYQGERFSGRDPAAMALLAVGKYFFDKKDEPMYRLAYETYLKYHAKHERAGGILFTLAGLRKQAGDEEGAAQYFQRIVDHYPNDPYYTKALNQMAWGYFAGSNYAAATTGFKRYLAEAQPGPDKAQAQLALADSLRLLDRLPEALAEYETEMRWLAPKDNPFATSARDAQRNLLLLEKAAFMRAYCQTRRKGTAEEIAAYRGQAIAGFDKFLALFGTSELAPQALNSKGAALLELGQYDAAARTFDELAARYPQSEEGKSALFSLVRSAMEIRQYDQARSAFARMMGDVAKYTPDEFARVGRLMLDAGLNAEAAQAFRQVSASTQERSLLERALFGIGQASYAQKDYAAAAKAMEELMTRYPKSGLFYDAKFVLGGAYRELGNLTNAVNALSDVFRYADTALLVNKASYELGAIQKQQDDRQAALASFMRVALLADAANAELRPFVESSLVESIELAMELGRYPDVQDSCDQYLKLFPNGEKVESVRQRKADARLKATEAQAAPPSAPPPSGTAP